MAVQIKTNQMQVWCLESTAANYPGFRSQLVETNDQYTRLVGIRHREVAWGDPACEVRHRMDSFPCGSGAAACIYYASKPVDVFYNKFLGFSDWRSAQAHELGHGILGQLHEMYQDSGGQITCLYRPETEMSCGPPYVRYPQPLDVQRGCAIINTSWCGVQQPAPPDYYEAPDGWRYYFATGNWHDSRDVPRFGPCNQDRLRLDLLDTHWWRPGGAYMGFDYAYGRHVTVPGC